MDDASSLLDVIVGSAGTLDRVRRVRAGLPIEAVQFVLDTGRLSPAESDRMVLPGKTLANRRRLCREVYADLGGEGARLYGGRWNLRSRPMIYAASSAALAVLEVRVHLDLPLELLPDDYVC